MDLLSMIGDTRAPSDGFFGSIGAAWETGIAKIGSEILPNWVQSQATRQSMDQMADNTFDSTKAPLNMTGQSVVQAGEPPTGIFQKALFDIKGGNFGNMPVLILAGVLLVGILFVLKKA